MTWSTDFISQSRSGDDSACLWLLIVCELQLMVDLLYNDGHRFSFSSVAESLVSPRTNINSCLVLWHGEW